MTGFDQTKPYMAVRHTEGRCKKEHYHVVGVPKEDFNHLTYDQDALYTERGPGGFAFTHPWREEFPNKKPFQTKKQKYDEDHFKYLVKPKEWAAQGADMVLFSSFTPEEIEELRKESELYFKKLKDLIPVMVAALPECDTAEEFHLKAMSLCLAKFEEQKKDPGPWLTHKVRMAVYRRSSRYEPYISSKYL